MSALTSLLANSSEWLLMGVAAAFAAMLGLTFYVVLSRILAAERAVREKLTFQSANQRRGQEDRVTRRVNKYFEKTRQPGSDALTERLHRAGFYGQQARTVFYIAKLLLTFSAFVLVFLFGVTLLPLLFALLAGLVASALFFVLPTIYLERRADRNVRAYRRNFPDFMDMMIVCADAGMSLEAAIGRVSRELSDNAPELGLHLEVMNLEMRAGRSMREALYGLARRTGLPEAKTLAVLFQQSEELGTSLISALRVYSDEMRQRRITAAEEKANALPIKMLLPLGGFIFPVILIVVLLPILVRLASVL